MLFSLRQLPEFFSLRQLPECSSLPAALSLWSSRHFAAGGPACLGAAPPPLGPRGSPRALRGRPSPPPAPPGEEGRGAGDVRCPVLRPHGHDGHRGLHREAQLFRSVKPRDRFGFRMMHFAIRDATMKSCGLECDRNVNLYFCIKKQQKINLDSGSFAVFSFVVLFVLISS